MFRIILVCVILMIKATFLAGNGIERLETEFKTIVADGQYHVNKSINVDTNVEYIFRFPDSNSKYPYLVYAWGQEAYYNHPVFIVVRQQNDVTSWDLPLAVQSKAGLIKFTATSRILCHNNMDLITQMPRNLIYSSINGGPDMSQLHKQLSMSISTASNIPTSVTFRVEEQTNFYVEEDSEYVIKISPSEPRYFYYKFLDEGHENYTNTVILEVNSEDDVCLTVSIQKPKCPVADLNQDISYGGKHQTVNNKGGIIIKKKEFPNGFFIVFVAKGDDYGCKQDSAIPLPKAEIILPLNFSTEISFTIKPSISKDDYVIASVSTLGVILLFYLVFSFTTWAFYRWGVKQRTEEDFEMETRSNGMMDGTDVNFMRRPDNIDSRLASHNLVLSDLAKTNPELLEKKSYAYLWHVLSIGIFYGIPVVQLVITYQRVVNISGNQDICYYNFLCAHPLFGLSDFNHIYSNIGYVLMGILFFIITFYKQHYVQQYEKCGIPKHYGLFYAMGVALIMEGILSACYHICPTQSNFQFDTSFMYVMAALCMVKLYQNRHPDINATAYATFVVLGFAIFAAMVGILNGHIALWISFIILYMILCFYVSFNIYFLSYVKIGVRGVLQEWNEEHNVRRTMQPNRKAHFTLLVIANIFNLIFVNLGILCYFKGTDFATFLLGLLMANAILYAIIYITMKLIHHERICLQAILFGVLGLATWMGAMYFFVNNSTAWTVSPAESRQWNTHCIMLDFYDHHDVWHLMSAPALFCTFMLLLCLDDDLVNTPHEDIVVF